MAPQHNGGQHHQLHYVALASSKHHHPKGHRRLEKTGLNQKITGTFILWRKAGSQPMKDFSFFQSARGENRKPFMHKDFAEALGASPQELKAVTDFISQHHLHVQEVNPARRTVVGVGTAAQWNRALAITLHEYSSPRGPYHGHDEPLMLPEGIAATVEVVLGLDNRPVPARHYASGSANPPDTKPLLPSEVSSLYNFPKGGGSGQTIGIYEMAIGNAKPGYSATDVAATMQLFGVRSPKPVDVSVDGETNTGVSDGETLLDVTVSSAIAQEANIAVYFTAGASTQNIVHALQRMIHPGQGDPVPTVVSISYGWGPDNDTDDITPAEYTQMSELFQDAAHLGITALVSSGDSGAEIDESVRLAEASYPASDPWVTACGGTTVGNVNGSKFEEFVWNEGTQGGATGGGVSAQFPLPSYQQGFPVPVSLYNGFNGRGLPDIAGNASPYSGYPQSQKGSVNPIGGTSAVAPLYAGLVAVMNANLGFDAGFLNPVLYSAAAKACLHYVSGPPGPENNSFGNVTGYPAPNGQTWNACTGLGRPDGTGLQGLFTASQTSRKSNTVRPKPGQHQAPSRA